MLLGQLSSLNNSKQLGNRMPLPGVLPGQLSSLNSSKQPRNKMHLPGVLPGQLSSLNSSKQPRNRMPLPGVLPGQLSSLNSSKQPRIRMPLPGVLPGQPSLLNSNMQSGNKMPLPGVLPGQPNLLISGKQPGEGLAPGDLGSKPYTLRMRWRGWWYIHWVPCHIGAHIAMHSALSTIKKRTTLCCGDGKMSRLSNAFPAPAPQPLRDLLTSVPSEHQPLPPAIKDFKQNIRAYNSALQMASTGLHIHSPEQGINMIAIKGAMHHLLGPLQPAEHDVPQFAQLYIIDSMDAQVTARLATLGAMGAVLH